MTSLIVHTFFTPCFEGPRPLKLICGTKDDTGKRSAGQKVGGREKAGKGLRRRPAGRTTLCFIAANPFQPFTTLNGPSVIQTLMKGPMDTSDIPFYITLTSGGLAVSIFCFVCNVEGKRSAFLMHAFTFTRDRFFVCPRGPFL